MIDFCGVIFLYTMTLRGMGWHKIDTTEREVQWRFTFTVIEEMY